MLRFLSGLSSWPLGDWLSFVVFYGKQQELKGLNWNVRGLNSDTKWNSIRDKIVKSNSEIVCLQETKKEAFNISFIKKSALKALIALSLSLQLGPLGASWLLGRVRPSGGQKFLIVDLLCLWNSPQSLTMKHGY